MQILSASILSSFFQAYYCQGNNQFIFWFLDDNKNIQLLTLAYGDGKKREGRRQSITTKLETVILFMRCMMGIYKVFFFYLFRYPEMILELTSETTKSQKQQSSSLMLSPTPIKVYDTLEK